MTRDELNALADRVEAANMVEAADLMREAFEASYPYPGSAHYLQPEIDWTWDKRRDRFEAMLGAEAYESAALTLVPEGWKRLTFERHDDGTGCFLGPLDNFAATPALALTAAALRARAKEPTNDQ